MRKCCLLQNYSMPELLHCEKYKRKAANVVQSHSTIVTTMEMAINLTKHNSNTTMDRQYLHTNIVNSTTELAVLLTFVNKSGDLVTDRIFRALQS